MKILKSVIAAFVITTILFACKKDSDNTGSAVEGTYSGKYGYGVDNPSYAFKFRINSGGSFQELSTTTGNPTGQGTWQLNGSVLTATYTMLFSPYSVYSISASYNSSTKKLAGSWGYDNNPNDGGKIDMTKQ